MKKQFDFDKMIFTRKLLVLNQIDKQKLLLAVSGGVDSVVLAHHMDRVHGNLSVAYFHHGLTSNKQNNAYRNRAQSLVKNLAQEMNVPFYTNEPQRVSQKQSEESLRDARQSFFREICDKENIQIIVKAHHQDDLLETRLIRLIRGVGAEGFTAMKIFDSKSFRPLLNWDKNEISEYARKYKLEFAEDPSNKDETYLRNWIRHNWLQSLEKKRPGARSSLTKSLENLAHHLNKESQRSELDSLISDNKILKTPLLVLNKSEQRRVLAHYLHLLRVKNYTLMQIDEILKRLDKSQKEFTFTVANCRWTVDTRHISAETN